jgi:hypothetical protein
LKVEIALEKIPARNSSPGREHAGCARENYHFMHNEISRSENDVSDSVHEETLGSARIGDEV